MGSSIWFLCLYATLLLHKEAGAPRVFKFKVNENICYCDSTLQNIYKEKLMLQCQGPGKHPRTPPGCYLSDCILPL
jgi:hypothetical protein